MKTLEMEVALMTYLNVRQNIIVPNIYWGMELLYECDLVKLTKNGYATEIEIKISKADLKKDREKRFQHDSFLFKYLYFAVPIELKEFALQEIMGRAGLYTVEKNKRYPGKYIVSEVRKPIKYGNYKWSDKERLKLASLGTMRILTLKNQLLKGVI